MTKKSFQLNPVESLLRSLSRAIENQQDRLNKWTANMAEATANPAGDPSNVFVWAEAPIEASAEIFIYRTLADRLARMWVAKANGEAWTKEAVEEYLDRWLERMMIDANGKCSSQVHNMTMLARAQAFRQLLGRDSYGGYRKGLIEAAEFIAAAE